MTNEEKGILGEKYVSKKIKEVIKTLGKDIRLYGPIILKYYSIYGEMTCDCIREYYYIGRNKKWFL